MKKRTTITTATSVQVNLTDMHCSVYPKSNDWEKLGLDHQTSSYLSPVICPKNVHNILTGAGMMEVCVECTRMLVNGVQLVRLLAGGGEEVVKCDESNLTGDENSVFIGMVCVCNDNARKLMGRFEPLVGAQFVLHRANHGAVRFTPYMAGELEDGAGFCAVFKHRELGVVFVFHPSSKAAIMAYIQAHGARLEFTATCAHCGTAARLSKCGGCGRVGYCGTRCQAADWGSHRAACGGKR